MASPLQVGGAVQSSPPLAWLSSDFLHTGSFGFFVQNESLLSEAVSVFVCVVGAPPPAGVVTVVVVVVVVTLLLFTVVVVDVLVSTLDPSGLTVVVFPAVELSDWTHFTQTSTPLTVPVHIPAEHLTG